MLDVHPDAELAPRDVVARGIAVEMAAQGGRPVMLDATALGAGFLARRFPTIDAACRAAGLDWSRRPDPGDPGRALLDGRGRDRHRRPHDACRGSSPSARSPAPARTAPTGSPRTRCSRGWSSRTGPPARSGRRARTGSTGRLPRRGWTRPCASPRRRSPLPHVLSTGPRLQRFCGSRPASTATAARLGRRCGTLNAWRASGSERPGRREREDAEPARARPVSSSPPRSAAASRAARTSGPTTR